MIEDAHLYEDRFVNLEAESAYSFLHGTYRPEELVRTVKSLGQRAVALTDRWSMYGLADFVVSARKEGIQPIIGARIMLKDGSWLSLYPLNRNGFKNLNAIITNGLLRSPTPFVTLKELRDKADDLIAIAGGHLSMIRAFARKGNIEAAEKGLLELKSIFDYNLYLGLSKNVEDDRATNRLLNELAAKHSIRAIISNPVVYLRKCDAWLHRLLIKIQVKHHKRTVTALAGDSFYPLTLKKALELIPYENAALETIKLAQRLKGFKILTGQSAIRRNLAQYETESAKDILWKMSLKALSRRYSPCAPAYISRLSKEIEVISQKGLSKIFLLMSEIKRFSDSKGIISSIRGSSGGSLLVHLLLGGPDPIRHRLLFERFINQGRVDIPDIDMDFDSERRDEVTHWLLNHEPERSALVATIHTFRPRSAVRLLARAMGYPLYEIERLTKCLPWSLRGISLERALQHLPELKDSPLKNEKHLVRAAERLEGLPFQSSVHLGGVVVAPDDILYWSPLFSSRKEFRVTHLDKDAVEALGLLKLDLLGLRMHTAIKKALECIPNLSAPSGQSIKNIPIDDRKTYELLSSGDTLGVFQLESPGQRNLVARLLPERFEDIVAEISLFRPGPVKSDMVTRYLKRRHGEEAIDCLHPILAPILEETYGVIVFQEQVLEIVHRFAGFSYDDADAFRRAMTKNRSKREMERLKQAFMDGAKRMGHSKELAEKVFKRVSAFAAYGFCKAHAVAFSEITLKSAYIKAHYPKEFYIGLLNADHVGSYPPGVILNEARRKGIPIYPPNVNKSALKYAPEGPGIRLPLTVIYGIGPRIAQRIIEERDRNGPYFGIYDLKARTGLNNAVLDTLYIAGTIKGALKAA